jgi:hypothetical protein
MPTSKHRFHEHTEGGICRIPLSHEETMKGPPATAAKLSDITWRIFRIMAEFVEGFQFLSESSREVTVFGSARTSPSDRWYKEAEAFGRLLAKNGYTVITGGGPGIMEAANKGAFEAGGESLGLNIQLPVEQRINPYVRRGRGFHYFFTRKVMLAASAQAYVFFPGGFGTLDEFTEMITLIQTKKAQQVPVVCVGKKFWTPFVSWMHATLIKDGHVSPADAKLFTVVDTAEEALKIVKTSKERTFF